MADWSDFESILMDMDVGYISVSERQDGMNVWRTGQSGEWIAYKPSRITEVRA